MSTQRDDNKRIYLTHRIKAEKTLQDFMKRERVNYLKVDDVFNENKDFIFQQMSLEDKEAFKEAYGVYPEKGDDLKVDMTLPCPCKIKVNPYGITADLAISQTNFQIEENDFYAFQNEKIQKIIEEDNNAIINEKGKVLDKSVPGCQVFVWTKTDYWNSREKDTRGRTISQKVFFREISQDVISITTNSSSNGGNFTIQLPVIDTVVDNQKVHVVDSGENLNFKSTFIFPRTLASQTGFKSSILKRFNFYEMLLSSNDLIFISLKKTNSLGRNVQIIDEDDIATLIAEGNFDMIGLVDSVKVNKSANGASASVSVTGRDLMKLLIEDGSFFFNKSTTDSPAEIFNNTDEETHGDIMDVDYKYGNFSIKRLRGAANELDFFRNPLNNSVSYVLKGVIAKLVNVEVVPHETFAVWKDKTTFNDFEDYGQ